MHSVLEKSAEAPRHMFSCRISNDSQTNQAYVVSWIIKPSSFPGYACKHTQRAVSRVGLFPRMDNLPTAE